MHGLTRRQLHAFFAVRLAQIAAGDKFSPDLLQIPCGFRARERVEHACKIRKFLLPLRNLLRQDFFGIFGFLIVFIEFCCVLLRGDGRVERDLNLLHIRVIEVGGAQFCLAAFDSVEICRENIAETTQTLPVVGRSEFFALVFQLPCRSRVQIGDGFADSLRCLAHGIGAVTRGIEPVEQLRERVIRLLSDKIAVLRHGQAGKVPRAFVLVQKHRLRRYSLKLCERF